MQIHSFSGGVERFVMLSMLATRKARVNQSSQNYALLDF